MHRVQCVINVKMAVQAGGKHKKILAPFNLHENVVKCVVVGGSDGATWTNPQFHSAGVK